MPDVTRMEPALQVSVPPRRPSAALTGRVCQAIIRAQQAREVRRVQLQRRFGCSWPAWAEEYVRHGKVRNAERDWEAAG